MKLDDKQRSRLSCIILICVFAVFLLAFVVGTILSEDRDFSEMENRTLAQKPEISKEAVSSGKLDDDFEEYYSDQIFLKDALMAMKTTCDYAVGKTCQNGVFFGSDGYMLQQYIEDTENVEANISYLNDFAKKLDVDVDLLLVPNSIAVNSDKLPIGAFTDDQLETVSLIENSLDENIAFFNPYEILCELEQAYYRTDHHWTAAAAKTTIEQWLLSAGFQLKDIDYSYNQTENFYGSLYSKAPAAFVKPDTFDYYENPTLNVTVEYVSESSRSDSLIDESYLDKKDKYSSLLGGNFSQIKITSECESDEKLLLLKDSYANAVVPILANYFSEIYIIDLRYFHFESVSKLVEEQGIDRVLMLYNVDFINEDKNFVWLE
ncbi:MAG: hypothetical protein LUE12_03990 [Ruminococcus sp.]|nr:hypothetical protein [Ruminococcus sp.]